MWIVYILQGASGRHYIGQTGNLAVRFAQHQGGHTHTTQRLGGNLRLIASRQFPSREDALKAEKQLKAWKNPAKAISFLSER